VLLREDGADIVDAVRLVGAGAQRQQREDDDNFVQMVRKHDCDSYTAIVKEVFPGRLTMRRPTQQCRYDDMSRRFSEKRTAHLPLLLKSRPELTFSRQKRAPIGVSLSRMNAEPRRRRGAERAASRGPAPIPQLAQRHARNPYPPMRLISDDQV